MLRRRPAPSTNFLVLGASPKRRLAEEGLGS
jgi:hypothetical protein